MEDNVTQTRIKWPRIIGVVVLLLVVVGFVFFKDKILNNSTIKQMSQNNKTESTGESLSGVPRDSIINVGVVTWPGYAGGEYFNEGFEANRNSRYFKDYGFYVEFKVIDDFNASREAFKSGEIDILWSTIDAFPTEITGMSRMNPKVLFFADKSRGADAIVAVRGINKVSDLKGRKIAVAPMTPSHTLLLNLFRAGEIKPSDVTIIEMPSAIEAADLFRKNQCDAAVVWSPDDEDCITKVEGSKILISTATATDIISDVFIAKQDFIDQNQTRLKGLVEGWLKGNSEINNGNSEKAVKILAAGLKQPEEFCRNGLAKVRLCTYGDNVNLFNVSGNFKGVSGEDIYNKMVNEYSAAISPVSRTAYIASRVPNFRAIIYPKFVNEISLPGEEHMAEGSIKFSAPTKQDYSSAAVASVKASITFPTNSYVLDENAKRLIDLQLSDIAKSFQHARFRIEGNTDNTGDNVQNKRLSKLRAKAVADYLTSEYNFDPNRFVILGNGSDKPVSGLDANSKEGRDANRRTDFELISSM